MTAARSSYARRALVVAGAMCAAAWGAACASPVSLDQLERLEGTAALGGEADTATSWRATSAQPVTLEFSLPSRATDGEPVPVRVRVRNGGAAPVSVGLGQFDAVQMVVSRVDRPAALGAIYSIGPAAALVGKARGAVVTDPIRPGRDSTFEILWPQTDDRGTPVPAGAYRVRAVVNAQLVGTRRLWTAWDTVVVAR